MRRVLLLALLAGTPACADAPDPRAWMSAALFLSRDTSPAVFVIDTTAGSIPAAAREQLSAAGFTLGGSGEAPASIRLGDVRARRGGVYELDADVSTQGGVTHWRLTIECRSRHCLVIDSTRAAS